MAHQFFTLFCGWLTTGALLVIQHLLWRTTSRQVRYLLGGGAICAGCTVAGVLSDDVLLAIAPWGIASAGLIVLLLYWFEAQTEATRRAAQANGEIIGAARGLTQELIDRGGHDAQSRVDQTRFRN